MFLNQVKCDLGTEDGVTVESGGEKKRVRWSGINRVKIVGMCSLMHNYDNQGERVYSFSTGSTNTVRLLEMLKLKTTLPDLD
jgi:hypothetical protein